jgi:hypothetical protein
MKKHIITLSIIWGLVIILGFVVVSYVHAAPMDKFDGECTGQETAGRCSDKCPVGSYNIGWNADGSAICKAEPTGCPYGDSIPLGDACDKAALVQSDVPKTTDTSTVQYTSDFAGK